MAKPLVPIVLSFNGGYVDTAGFLALQGLFTAHVTGNFVTLGAALALGTTGVVSKLLALPVFCAVVVLTRLASWSIPRRWPGLSTLLTVKVLLLIAAAVLAMRLGPFPNGDSAPAVITGMVLVAAMAIQNALHRMHLGTAPPSTLMTGTTTQLMIDVADSIRGIPAEQRVQIRERQRNMATAMLSFAAGAIVAAVLFRTLHMACFIVPPIVSLMAWILSRTAP
jgi:uncharacterized membrane protein YoaK (UPF0700 family)